LLEPDNDLARAQSAIDEDPAMIGRNQRAISGAAAPEHGQSEHARLVADTTPIHKSEIKMRDEIRKIGGTGSVPSHYSGDATEGVPPSSPAIFFPGNARTRAFFAP
jgi:hypothetical protein